MSPSSFFPSDPHERILADVHIRIRRRVRLHAAPRSPLPTAAALGVAVRPHGRLCRRRRRHLRLRHKGKWVYIINMYIMVDMVCYNGLLNIVTLSHCHPVTLSHRHLQWTKPHVVVFIPAAEYLGAIALNFILYAGIRLSRNCGGSGGGSGGGGNSGGGGSGKGKGKGKGRGRGGSSPQALSRDGIAEAGFSTAVLKSGNGAQGGADADADADAEAGEAGEAGKGGTKGRTKTFVGSADMPLALGKEGRGKRTGCFVALFVTCILLSTLFSVLAQVRPQRI